jgi:hypothetical protein
MHHFLLMNEIEKKKIREHSLEAIKQFSWENVSNTMANIFLNNQNELFDCHANGNK